jgi:WD40 repeat protein
VLSVGLSNGKLMQYRKKGFEQKNLLSSKEFEIVRFFDVLGGHKGEIRCLCYEYIKGARYLITGSSDRNIKIWENDPKAKQVVQTLVGHNGSILALKYARSSDTIFSASNDKTLKIWKQEDGREFLFHPCTLRL